MAFVFSQGSGYRDKLEIRKGSLLLFILYRGTKFHQNWSPYHPMKFGTSEPNFPEWLKCEKVTDRHNDFRIYNLSTN